MSKPLKYIEAEERLCHSHEREKVSFINQNSHLNQSTDLNLKRREFNTRESWMEWVGWCLFELKHSTEHPRCNCIHPAYNSVYFPKLLLGKFWRMIWIDYNFYSNKSPIRNILNLKQCYILWWWFRVTFYLQSWF